MEAPSPSCGVVLELTENSTSKADATGHVAYSGSIVVELEFHEPRNVVFYKLVLFLYTHMGS
jgi:hypothetical protein